MGLKPKSSLIFLFLFVLGIVSVHAQEPITPDKRIKGGLSFSRLYNTDWESTAKPGFTFGLSLNFKFSESFSVQPEVLYVEKGGREQASSVNEKFALVMDYLEVPLLAKYHLRAEGLFRPHLYLGPYVAFLLENNSNLDVNDEEVLTPDKLIDGANSTDVGGILGIGTDIHLPFNTISAELRYSIGLTDAFNDLAPQKIRTGALSFMIGFRF